MCNAGLALQLGGVATNTVGAFYTAAGNRVALGAQAAVADMNARIATDNGRVARMQGEQQIVARRMETGRNRAALRVEAAGNGVDLSEGTAANAIATNDIIGEIDALTIDANAIRAQGAANMEASNYRSQAKTARLTASAISPFAEAGIALTGGLSGVAARYADWGSSGKAKTKSGGVSSASYRNDPRYPNPEPDLGDAVFGFYKRRHGMTVFSPPRPPRQY